MSKRAHAKVVFELPNQKLMSCGFDFEVGGTAADWTQGHLEGLIDAFYDGFDGSPAVNAATSSSHNFVRAEAFAWDETEDGDHPPCKGLSTGPFKRAPSLGPFVTTGAAKPGTAGADAASPQVTPVLTFRTNLSSRRTRGRVYTPPPPDSLISTTGVLTTSFRDDLRQAWQDWIGGAENSAPATVTFTHVVWTHCTASPGNTREVTAYTMGRRVDTQRRRLARGSEL
jgi:hypothetical protein